MFPFFHLFIYPVPQTPLSPNAAFTLARSFIKSCPDTNPPLPVKANPALALPATATPGSHVELTFDIPKDAESKQLFAIFCNGGDCQSQPISVEGDKKEVKIPANLFGTTYVYISWDETKTDDQYVVAGPAIALFPFDSSGNSMA